MSRSTSSFSKQELAVPALENIDSICLIFFSFCQSFPPTSFPSLMAVECMAQDNCLLAERKCHKVTHQLLILIHLFLLCLENAKKGCFSSSSMILYRKLTKQ